MRIEEQVNNIGFNGLSERPMLDLAHGGQQGYMPQLAGFEGKTFDEWLSNAAYVKNNIIPIPLRVPGMFNLFDDAMARRLRKVWIDIFSLHAMTIQGIESTITLDTDEHRVGAGGEFQEEFVKSNRARSTITYELQEKLGKPVNRFLDFLIRYGIADPDTQSALIGTLPNVRSNFKGNIYTPDFYTGTMLFAELDNLNINVQDAWLSTNFAPKSAGEVTASRDLGASKELKLYSIECTSITLNNEMTRAYAQMVVDRMGIFQRNPDNNAIFVNQDEAAQALQNSDGSGFNREDVGGNVPDGSQVTPEDVFSN